jgi:predicted ester cyclase
MSAIDSPPEVGPDRVAADRAVVSRFIDEVLLGGQLDVIAELCDPDVVNHAAPAGRQHGLDGMSQAVRESLLAMSDQEWLDVVIVAQDGYVVIHATLTAIWRAPEFRGIAVPTEGRVSIGIVHIFRLRAGLIVAHWAIHDELSLLKQRGAVP